MRSLDRYTLYVFFYCYSPFNGSQLFDISPLARHLPGIVRVLHLFVSPVAFVALPNSMIVG